MTFCASRSISLSSPSILCVVLWFRCVVDSLKWWLHDDNLAKCTRAQPEPPHFLSTRPAISSLSEFVSRRSLSCTSTTSKGLDENENIYFARFGLCIMSSARLDLLYSELNIHFLFFTCLDDHFESLLLSRVLRSLSTAFCVYIHEIPSLVLFLLLLWSKETPES